MRVQRKVVIEKDGQSWTLLSLSDLTARLQSSFKLKIKDQDGQPWTQPLQWRPVSAAGCGKLNKIVFAMITMMSSRWASRRGRRRRRTERRQGE